MHDLLTADDLFLFNEGTHSRLYEKLGAHPASVDGRDGVAFAVWAPDAETVTVAGPFNHWDGRSTELHPVGSSGIWQGFVPGIGPGELYKYHVYSRYNNFHGEKADPFAFRSEVPPATASVVADLSYEWHDQEWMANRGARQTLKSPMSIYELHLGSWMRGDGNSFLSYREHADRLVEHCQKTGFTHVEFLPVMEHPFFGSWGYQVTGYFAPTSRFGEPQDLMFLIDHLHQNGIGVILDWVPSHFPTDAHGLGQFDGTALYEHADPRRGFHQDWDTYIFNYGRNEVRAFLISSAIFWLDKYHIDGLRVDAVASMLYRDYSRKAGEWLPNQYGGREDLEAISFLRQMNEACYGFDPSIQMIAEESTAWPMVSRPTYVGGLGFGLKWDMGWMHDTLQYMSSDPVHRRYHHGELTFRGIYAFTENFALPLSHDEVVHGKGSLIGKMPGDDWQKFANLRVLLSYQWLTPGKKLLFMGGEIGQWAEWNHESSVNWHLLEQPENAGIQQLVGDLNRLYRQERALHEGDCEPAGFEWVDANDAEQSTLTFLRRSLDGRELCLVACNFTPVPRHNFRAGVSRAGHWDEVLNSDAPVYGGSGQGNLGGADTTPVPAHGRPHSLIVTLPPLSVVVFRAPTI